MFLTDRNSVSLQTFESQQQTLFGNRETRFIPNWFTNWILCMVLHVVNVPEHSETIVKQLMFFFQ